MIGHKLSVSFTGDLRDDGIKDLRRSTPSGICSNFLSKSKGPERLNSTSTTVPHIITEDTEEGVTV